MIATRPTPASRPSPAVRPPVPTRFFYGWLVVAVAALAAIIGAGLDHVAFGVVLKPMSEEQGWPRSVVSGAVATGTLAAAVIAPFAGQLADRLGPRLLIAGGALATGGLTLAMSFANEPWQFYAAYVPARALATSTLGGVVALTAAANWFQHKRPRAIGMVSMAAPVGAAVMAQFYQGLLGGVGWRGAFVALAGLTLAVALPAAWLLRRRPEDVGLRPDGAAGVAASQTSPAPAEDSWSPGAAARTPAFWLIIASFMLAALSIGSIGFHLVAYFTDTGVDPATAAGILSLYALTGGAAILLWGFLSERVHVRYLAVAILGLSGAAVLLLLNVQGVLGALLFAVLYGFTGRSQSTLVQIMLANYFGRRFFGSISGITIAFQLAVMGISPWVAALVFDLTGSYADIFRLFIALYGVSAACMFLARKPEARPMVA